MTPPFRLESLGAQHDRGSFHCGEDTLDRYFQTQATQDVRRRITNCFVAVETGTGRIAAYYTLSAASISPRRSSFRRNEAVAPISHGSRRSHRAAGRRPELPWTWLSAALLGDAAARALKADAAAFMLLVDALNEQSVAFYQRFGFRTLASRPRTLFLPLATAQKAFGESPVH